MGDARQTSKGKKKFVKTYDKSPETGETSLSLIHVVVAPALGETLVYPCATYTKAALVCERNPNDYVNWASGTRYVVDVVRIYIYL